MAKRFLRPLLVLISLTIVLGINFWWLAKKNFIYHLPSQTPKARFCRCLRNEDDCQGQDNRHFSQEVDRWERLVKNDPAYPDGWAKLAVAWFYKGRYDLAVMTVERAVDLAPFRGDLKKLEKRIKSACT